jgi:signal transduction histidine kinase
MRSQEMTKKQVNSELEQLRQRNAELEKLEYDHKRTEEKLRIYQEQLRSLASKLLLTEERERRRLASDIHDSISQNLAISKIELDELRRSFSSSSLEQHLKKISGLINKTIQQIRSMTFELSPPVLYDIGIEAAIEYLVKRMQKQFGIHIHFTDDKQSKKLNEDLRVLVFRAVQELLFNVVKHARTQKVRVSIARTTILKFALKTMGLDLTLPKSIPAWIEREGSVCSASRSGCNISTAVLRLSPSPVKGLGSP